MNKLYEVTDTLLLWQTIGCLIGLCISIVLVQLVKASWNIQSLRRPGILLSVALMAWNGGDLVNALLITLGYGYLSVPPRVACAFGYSGLTLLTWAVLSAWELSVEGRWRKRVHTILQTLAVSFGVWLTVWLWMDTLHSNAPLSRTAIRIAVEASLYVFVLIGMALALSSRPVRTTRLCAKVTGFGVIGPVVVAALIPLFGSLPPALRIGLSVYAEQSINYVAVAAFILLARSRYTDILVERALKVLSVILSGSFLWYCIENLFARLPNETDRPAALAIAVIASITILALSVSLLNRGIRKLTQRIFEQPDFDAELGRLSNSLQQIPDEPAVLRRCEDTLLELFQFPKTQIVPAESLSPDLLRGLRESETLEQQPGSHFFHIEDLAADALVRICRNGQDVVYVIAIARSTEQRGFLASEEVFLRHLAHVISIRLAGLRIEREKIEHERREAMLLHQTMEAELRALRAQINPHFLFNALNTIADLITVDGGKAEKMTERLADVFRHVLTHSQKSMITVREEIEFVRRYLEIEEARFRDRLQVHIDMDSTTAEMQVPALILQPLVENAINHGLAPKVEGGQVFVSARCLDHGLLLVVEDNGIGFVGRMVEHPPGARANGNRKSRSTGVGLTNITQRLRTLYGDKAELVVERPAETGCRVTIKIPS
ncbi:MAG: histidine kinase [Acidobacteria bacterium]|nr:histidine kinase [Acidobacteriota bacterium]